MPPLSEEVPNQQLTVYFQPGESMLSDSAKADIDDFLRAAKTIQGLDIVAAGSASSNEYDGNPTLLAEDRAEAVRKYILSKDIPEEHIAASIAFDQDSNTGFPCAILYYVRRIEKNSS
jgi:outer membrane protein OmpA-like peptidoglycan-associated protein